MATSGFGRGLAIVLATALLSIPSVATGATHVGLLDPTFGVNGRVRTDLSTIAFTEDSVDGVAVQPDGKILAAGYRNSSSDQWMALARYATDGTLDPTFGGDGVVLTHFASGAGGSAVALQPNSKIVVVGWTFIRHLAVFSFAVARYNEDGTLDDTFSEDGRVRTAIGDEDSEALGVALQDDGNIVVVGEATEAGTRVFAVARYTTGGSLDGSFGAGGTTTTSFGISEAWARDVAVQPDGDIIAVGVAGAQNSWDLALARYGTEGTLDATFGTGGIMRTSFGEAQAQARAVALRPDGRIIVGGTDGSGGFAIVRYESDGSIDPTFAGDGTRSVSFSVGYAGIGVSDVLLGPEGTIVAVGSAGPSSNLVFAVARLEADGSLDQRFSGDGKVTTSFGAGDAWANSAAFGPDGSIVVGGSSPTSHRLDASDFALARYVVPASRPDAQLRSRWGEIVGDDIYNGSGRHQTLGDWRRSRTTLTIRIENDGSSADTYTVLGEGSTQRFAVRYRMDGTYVTRRAVGGTLTIGPIEAGAVTSLKIEIRARSSASPGTSFGRHVWISSTLDDRMVDAVRAVLHLV